MNTTRRLSRREVVLLLGGAAVTITACGGGGTTGGGTGSDGYSDPYAPTSPAGSPVTPPTAGDKDGAIAENHGHEARITAGQLVAGGSLLLDIRGSGDHRHMLALTGDEVARISAGSRVSKSSSTDDTHSHTVTFN
jgi:hypothetical protein